ncbi:MAG: DUF3108 domain-containing protein [Taibaiella sp.]|nr:DUF3108 domain-containing protein [Taibaiella sp.]
MEPGDTVAKAATLLSKTKKLLLTLSLLTGFSVSNAQNDFCNTVNTAYRPGEKLVFQAYYNMGFIWIYAGNAVFTVQSTTYNGKPSYYVKGDGRTAPSYEWFYKVRDLYESYIDQQTLLPLRHSRTINEGHISFRHDIKFDRTENVATLANGNRHPISRCTQDVVSAIYFARNIDYNKYTPGTRIPFDMFLDDKLYSLYIKYMGKEKVKTKKGTFNAIKIVPLLIEGTMFSGGEGMTVWVSDDKNHLPLRVSSPIVVGSVKADLMDYAGLANPFSSIIKIDD